MHGTLRLLELVRDHRLAANHLRGLFHIAIGRRIADPAGKVLTTGVTWRELAAFLKDAKYDKDLVRELGADPDTLSPKDREKFWYSAVAMARVDGPEAREQADRLAALLKPLGLVVGPLPGAAGPLPLRPRASKPPVDDDTDEQPALPPAPPSPPPPPPKKRKK
jgi:hypothetical protein